DQFLQLMLFGSQLVGGEVTNRTWHFEPLLPSVQFLPELAGRHVADRGGERGRPLSDIKLLRRQFRESTKLHSAFAHGHALPIEEMEDDSPVRHVHLELA